MSYVQTAEAKMRQQEHDDRERLFDDHDGFMYTAASFISGNYTIDQDDARDIMKYLHLDLVKVLDIFPKNKIDENGDIINIVMNVGDTIQAQAVLLYRDSDHIDKDVTGYADCEWITDPSPTTFLTVSQGLITATLTSTADVEVYAKIGDFESQRIRIEVA